jgi:CheY-like chemotaxis protein
MNSTGPRKLAKILLLAFKRWLESQALSPPTGELSGEPGLPAHDTNSIALHPKPSELPFSPDSHSIAIAEVENCPSPTATTKVMVPPQSDHPVSPTKVQDEPPDLSTISNLSDMPAPAENPSQPSGLVEFIIVDDNAINVKILSSYMKKLNRKYKTAENGLVAVDIYRQDPGRYGCVFMDINMPVMDGFEATRQIRALEREKRLPPASIFALSGLASMDAQQEAFSSGIDLFLTKPVRLKELSSILTTRGLL